MSAGWSPLVQQLAYLALDVEDEPGWRSVLTDVIGLAPREDAGDGFARFRLDDRHHRVAIRSSERTRVAAIGFQVADARALTQAGEHLLRHGFAVCEGTPEEAAGRGVMGVLKTRDPDGNPLELCWGQFCDERPPRLDAAVSGFIAGRLGLGHVFLATEDLLRFTEYYRDVLGFRVSDHMLLNGRDITFLRCNPRHHTVAGIQMPDAVGANPLHFMVEAYTIDDVGYALERCQDSGTPLALSLGRHSNDHMVSFYLRGPGGMQVEFGYGGRLVDESSWQITKNFRDSFWGHRDIQERTAP